MPLTKGTVNLGSSNPIYFDIETGGFWATGPHSLIEQKKLGLSGQPARPSSILSISWAQGQQAASTYSQPTPGSWVSRFSSENILPQLAGKAAVSEEQSIREFIGVLRANPTAPLGGYNIAGFDIDFLLGRAGAYPGLREELSGLIRSRTTLDVGFEVRDLIASAVDKHISDGVFSAQLGGRTFSSLEVEYFGGPRVPGVEPRVPRADQLPTFKTLSQVKGFVRGGYRGRVEGWKLAPVFEMYSKWAGMEDELSHLAHASAADVQMTSLLHQATRTGQFQRFVDRPEFGQQWLQMVSDQRAASAGGPPAGSFWPGATKRRAAAAADNVVGSQSVWRRASQYLPSGRDLKVLGGIAGVGIAAAMLYSAFSGYDDSYNTIEGLNHGGLAELKRKTNTDFGSGYTGVNLQGLPVDEGIMAFREAVLQNKEQRNQLKAELRELELEAQAELGSFEISDYMLFEKSVIEGINQQRRDLRRVNLDRFNIEVEDADSLVLRRKGILSSLFGKDVLVRLAGIDAPEVGGHSTDPLEFIRWNQEQAGGQEASEFLRERIAQAENLDLIIGTQGKTYGRYLGAIVADDENLNVELARAGQVSALPFGDISEDLVDRGAVARAERQAREQNAGIQAMARYKAIDVATQAAGRDITYNTITRLDKLGQDLNMGRYATFLESLGSGERDLTGEEAELAAGLGQRLRNRYSNRFSGKDDAYNTIEGLPHGGLSEELRKKITQFGSGWRRTKAAAEAAFNIAGNEEVGLAGTVAAQAVYQSYRGEEDSVFSSGAVLGSLGFYGVTKAAKFGLGLKMFHAPWKADPLPGMAWDIATSGSPGQALKAQMRLAHNNRMLRWGGRSKKINQSGNTIEGFGEAGMAKGSREDYGFGSPWRGIISLNKSLQGYYAKTKFGTAGRFIPSQSIDEITSEIGKQITREEKRFGGLGRFFGKGRRRQATQDLERLRAEMISTPTQTGLGVDKAYAGPILIDPSQVASGKELKGLIAHERLHQKIAGTPGVKQEIAQLSAPPEFQAALASAHKSYKNLAPQVVSEEYLAYSVTESFTGQQTQLYAKARQFLEERKLFDFERRMTIRPVKTVQKTKAGWRRRFERPFGVFFSGKDDAYNKVEGLHHGGFAKQLRKKLTPFGSGWDALRGLTKAGETFADMTKSKGFQKALAQAEEVKVLGRGGLGEVLEMKGTFRGQEFSFARKHALKKGGIGGDEASSMRAFQDEFAPTVYSASDRHIDMEIFQGKTLRDLADEGQVPSELLEQVKASVGTMHARGYGHSDLHAENIIITANQEVGIIDYGAAGKLNEAITLATPKGPEQVIFRPGGALGVELEQRVMGFQAKGRYGFYMDRNKEIDEAALGLFDRGIFDMYDFRKGHDTVVEPATVVDTIKNGGSGLVSSTDESLMSALGSPRSNASLSSNYAVDLSAATKAKPIQNLHSFKSDSLKASTKKLKRAQMQQAATKTVFVNSRGGKNSKM